MKNLLVAIIVLLSFSTQAQSTLDGLWDTGEANTKIDVSEKNSLWSGVVKASDIKDDIGELIFFLKLFQKNPMLEHQFTIG